MSYLGKTLMRLRLALSGADLVWASVSAKRQTARMFMEVIVTLIVLVCGFWGLLWSNADDGTKQLLAGFIGTAIGYWLRPEKAADEVERKEEVKSPVALSNEQL